MINVIHIKLNGESITGQSPAIVNEVVATEKAVSIPAEKFHLTTNQMLSIVKAMIQ